MSGHQGEREVSKSGEKQCAWVWTGLDPQTGRKWRRVHWNALGGAEEELERNHRGWELESQQREGTREMADEATGKGGSRPEGVLVRVIQSQHLVA